MKTQFKVTVAAMLLFGALGCGGATTIDIFNDPNVFAASLTLTNGSGGMISSVPASGSPAGVVTGKITLAVGLDVDPATMKMTVTREDSVVIVGSPKVMDFNATTREFSCALTVPDNTAGIGRTWTLTITGKDDVGAPVPFVGKVGTFVQSAAVL